jgi:hypothetical protein
MPWILGCGGCGLLIVLALVAFAVIARIGREHERALHAAADSTLVTGDTGAVESPPFSSESDTTSSSSEGVSDQAAKPGASATDDQSQQQGDSIPIKRIEKINP